MSGFTPTAVYEDEEPTIGPSTKESENETKEVENTSRETTPLPETTEQRPQTDDSRTTATSDTAPTAESTTRPADRTPTREPDRTTEREPERETQAAPENPRTTPEREDNATTGTPVRGTDFVDATVTRPVSATPTPSVDTTQNDNSSQNSDDSGSNSKGLIVGGIVAGVVAIAVLAFAFWWIKRRKRRAMHNEAAAFDASDFRRSAMLLNDPPTHADILAQGYGSGSSTGPRPPSMFQHRIASPAPTFGTQYGLPAPAMAYAQDTTSPVSYGINGQNYPAPYSPYTPSSADHLAAGTYSPSPYSPGFGDSQSMNHNSYQSNIASSRAGDHESYGRSDQVDLERSSVSPYQATQYAEISRQLDTEVPQGLNTPAVQEYMHQSNTAYGAPVAVAAASSIPPAYMSRPSSPSYTVPAEKLPSPFEDSDRNSYPREKETQSNPLAPIASHDTVQSFGAVPHLEFPAPPALDQANQHNRVDSTPPILPEISVSRDSYGFPAPVITHHSEGNNGTLHAGHQFPTTPSPLKSTFSHEAIADSAPAPAASATRAQEKPAAKRPDTVYDEGDVYGGI